MGFGEDYLSTAGSLLTYILGSNVIRQHQRATAQGARQVQRHETLGLGSRVNVTITTMCRRIGVFDHDSSRPPVPSSGGPFLRKDLGFEVSPSKQATDQQGLPWAVPISIVPSRRVRG